MKARNSKSTFNPWFYNQCLGFDGGLPANFLLELYDAEKMELKSQVTNKVPIFEVSNIDPGVSIKLYLYAENAKGTSDPAIIDDSVPNQQKHFVEGFLKIYIFIKLSLAAQSSLLTNCLWQPMPKFKKKGAIGFKMANMF